MEALRSRPFTVLNRQMEVHPDRVAWPTAILSAMGFHVRQVGDGPLATSLEEVVLVWGNPLWFPRALRSLLDLPAGRRPMTVIWHVEPLPLPRAAGLRRPLLRPRELAKIALRDPRVSDVYSNYRSLARLARLGVPDVLAVTTRERATFLAERGLDAVVVPYGYVPEDGRDLALERDLDVLFLGTLGIRRRRDAVRRLRRAGIRVEAVGSYHDPALWGEERTKLVNRAKIMLSVARFPGTLAGKRFLIGMACKALVLSDPLYDPAPYERGVHFVEAPLELLPEVAARYLADESERLRVAEQGHAFATRELTMERSVGLLLDAVAARLREKAVR